MKNAEQRTKNKLEKKKEDNAMEKSSAMDRIIEYFNDHEDTFTECIEQLDAWNGYLGDDRYYEMYELDEIYHDTDPSELLARAYYGYDEDSYTIDKYDQKHHDAFNPNRDYFRYNGYGNLVSSDYKDYTDHIDHWAVEQMQQYRNHIDAIDEDEELSALFDELESSEENND